MREAQKLPDPENTDHCNFSNFIMCIRAAHDGPHGAAPPPLRGVQAQLQDLQQPQEAQALRPQPGQAVRMPGLPSQVYAPL